MSVTWTRDGRDYQLRVGQVWALDTSSPGYHCMIMSIIEEDQVALALLIPDEESKEERHTARFTATAWTNKVFPIWEILVYDPPTEPEENHSD